MSCRQEQEMERNVLIKCKTLQITLKVNIITSIPGFWGQFSSLLKAVVCLVFILKKGKKKSSNHLVINKLASGS